MTNQIESAAVTEEAQETRFRTKAWGLTGMLVALYMINYADKAVLGLVARPLADEFGLTDSQIGIASGVFFFAFAIGGFGAGLLNKWTTLRWALALLALVWAVCMLPMVISASFAVLIAYRFLLGLAEGPSSALIHTAVYSWHPPEKRNIPSAWITSGGSFGKIAFAPLLAFVISIWGWRAAFITLAVISVAWASIWLLTWKDGPYGEQALRKKQAAAVEDTHSDPPTQVPWSKIILTPTFLGGAAAVSAMYALVTVVMTWLPSYFELGLGYSRLQAGSMFGFPSIAGVVAVFTMGFLSDRLLHRYSSRWARGVLPACCLMICGLVLLALPLAPTPGATVLVVSIGYGIGMSVFPLFNAAISQICPPDRMAGGLGIFLAIMAIGGLVAPYITGVIVEAASSPAEGYLHAFQIFGVIALVGAVIALLTVDPSRDAKRVQAATSKSEPIPS